MNTDDAKQLISDIIALLERAIKINESAVKRIKELQAEAQGEHKK